MKTDSGYPILIYSQSITIIQSIKMSTIISSKQMETKLYALVECLASNYGFDADEAFEFTRWETDVDHVGEILKVIEKTAEKPAPKKVVAKKESVKDDASEAPTESTTSDPVDKIAVCRKNIDLWTKKLATAKDADKQREKIEKEEKKLAKLLEKAPKVEEKKPEPKKVEAKKPAEKPAPKKAEKPAEKEKRIKRFSPVMAAQLKTALESVKVEMTDKLKKEFQQHVEDLTDDDFRKEGLADHMRTFAKLHAPTVETVAEESETEETVESEAEESETEEAEPETVTVKSDTKVVDVTLKELQDIGMTATIDPPGTFWDADNGRFVKGPEADDDEDFEDAKFEGKDYVVGEKTGRVYEARDSGDVFAGFIGVGKFKKMTK